jgi:Fur family transcriptional regulator, zinc uptake regulator
MPNQVKYKKNGVQLTIIRYQVFTILEKSIKPMGAYEILDHLKTVKANAEAMTVYRAIKFLIDKSLIHHIKSINKYSTCCHPESQQCILFVCNHCGKKQEIHNNSISSKLVELAKKNSFIPENTSIDIQGSCHECQ